VVITAVEEYLKPFLIGKDVSFPGAPEVYEGYIYVNDKPGIGG
jgi:hypothetical protein